MKSSIAICLLAYSFSVLFSCTQSKTPKPTDTATKVIAPAKPQKAEPDDNLFASLDKHLLLQRLFDNPQFDSTGMALWKPNFYESRTFSVSDDKKCHTSMDTILYFIDHDTERCAAVILATYNFREDGDQPGKLKIAGSHFEGATIGIALLSQNNKQQWELYAFKKAFATLGLWGKYKDSDCSITLKQIGEQWTCLSLHQGLGGSTGEIWNTETWYSIERSHMDGFPNSVMSEIFGYSPHEESQWGAVKKKDVLVKLIKKPKSYYDIELVTDSNGKKTTSYMQYSDKYNCFVAK